MFAACAVCIVSALSRRSQKICPGSLSTVGHSVRPSASHSCGPAHRQRGAPRPRCSHPGQGFFRLELPFNGCICNGPLVEKSCLVSSAVPSEAALGEHVHPEVSLSQPDAFSALTYRSVRSKRGRTAVRPEEGCGRKTGVLCARPRCQLGKLSGSL